MSLLLLMTEGCHLCEQAEQMLNSLVPGAVGATITLIDIADETHWQAQYAIRIPVLINQQTHAELDWPFNEVQLKIFLDSGLKL